MLLKDVSYLNTVEKEMVIAKVLFSSCFAK